MQNRMLLQSSTWKGSADVDRAVHIEASLPANTHKEKCQQVMIKLYLYSTRSPISKNLGLFQFIWCQKGLESRNLRGGAAYTQQNSDICALGTLEEGLQYNIVTVLIKKIRKKARFQKCMGCTCNQREKNLIVYVCLNRGPLHHSNETLDRIIGVNQSDQ